MLCLYKIFIFLLGHLQFFLHFFLTFMENIFKKHPIYQLFMGFFFSSLLNECTEHLISIKVFFPSGVTLPPIGQTSKQERRAYNSRAVIRSRNPSDRDRGDVDQSDQKSEKSNQSVQSLPNNRWRYYVDLVYLFESERNS